MADSNLSVPTVSVSPGVGQLVVEWPVAVDTSEFSGLPNMQLDKYEVWSHTANITNAALIATTATKLADVAQTQYTHKTTVRRWYWVRPKDFVPNAGNFSASGNATPDTATPGPNSIGTSQLQDDAVTQPKVANLAIGTGQLDNLAATNAKIGNAAIANAKVGNLEIDNAKIANLTIGTTKIGTLAVSRLALFQNTGSVDVGNSGSSVQIAGSSGLNLSAADGRIIVIASASIYAKSDNASNWGSFKATLYEDDVAVANCIARPDDENQDGFFFIPYVNNSPGVDTHNYKVAVAYITSPGPGNGMACRNRFLMCLNDMR